MGVMYSTRGVYLHEKSPPSAIKNHFPLPLFPTICMHKQANQTSREKKINLRTKWLGSMNLKMKKM